MDDQDQDTRTRAQKIGELQVKAGKPRGVMAQSASTMPTLNVAERAAKLRARKLALDYSEEAVLNLVTHMRGEKVKESIEASKVILQYGLGKPATVHFGSDGGQQMPSLTIVFGDQAPVPFETYQAEFEIIDGETEED